MAPDPLTGRVPDVDCNSLTSPNTYTGPSEVWWAPYDNRPGSSVVKTLDDNYPRGLIWPYVEQNPAVFKCPNGTDLDPASPTFGQDFQCSYAMNYVTGGPSGKRLTDMTNGSSNIVIVWDHGRTPGCANSAVAAPRGPWRPYVNDADTSQYPALTKKAVQIVSGAKKITQYFDRDSRPDFAGPNGMQGFLLKFLSNPSQDPTNLQKDMQNFWDSLPPE